MNIVRDKAGEMKEIDDNNNQSVSMWKQVKYSLKQSG